MNGVLGVHYGTVGAEHSASIPDVGGAVALFRLHCALPRPGVKISSLGTDDRKCVQSFVQAVGGDERAEALLAEHAEMLARWARMDAAGRKVAHVVMRSLYDEAYAQATADRWKP